MRRHRRDHPPAEAPPPAPPPQKVPQQPAPPTKGELAYFRVRDWIAGKGDLGELAAAIRACTPAERAFIGSAVPFSTGLTGARCEQLRAVFTGIAKES
jgi:hypothetical protein